jgi:hypothetical protein
MNKFLGIGVLGALALGAIKLLNMQKLSDKLVSSLSNPRIYKVNLSGITFKTEISLQNPTSNTMTITKPVVTLTTNGKVITSNSPEQKTFEIKSLGTTMIDTIELSVSWTTLAKYVTGIVGKVPAIMAAFKKSDLNSVAKALAIPLEMQYTLYADNMYYESQPEILVK